MQNPVLRVSLFCTLVFLSLSSCKKSLYTSLKSEVDNVVETVPANHAPVSANVTENCGGYYVATPTRYDSSAKKYPLILFIHGIGELGNGTTDLSKMIRTGLPYLLYKKRFPASFEVNGENFSFVVVSPQFKKRPSNTEVYNVLQYMTKKYRVDTSRIYVTGLSMGGGVTWEFSSQYANSVAAITPICGGSYPDVKRAQRMAAAELPVWAFHNSGDKVVPVSYTKDYVSNINSSHPSVTARSTIWTSDSHDAWTKAYNPEYREDGKNMYEWMLGYRR